MSGAQNAIVGDSDLPTNLPETTLPDNVLAEERKLAKYSRTAEFKRLKEFMEARVQFYQRYLPNGTRVQGDPKDTTGITIEMPKSDMTAYWVAACVIINEFENILAEYERAAEVVAEHERPTDR